MSEDNETKNDSLSLYMEQTRDVQGMRNALMSFNKSDPAAAKKAIQNITILRVYHQISRIVRYLDLMDKIEEKMYESIECSLSTMDSYDKTTWVALAALQEKLQKSMIESHKLLEPYLNFDQLTVMEVPQEDPNTSFTSMILDQQSREKLRNSAQAVLASLGSSEASKDGKK